MKEKIDFKDNAGASWLESIDTLIHNYIRFFFLKEGKKTNKNKNNGKICELCFSLLVDKTNGENQSQHSIQSITGPFINNNTMHLYYLQGKHTVITKKQN